MNRQVLEPVRTLEEGGRDYSKNSMTMTNGNPYGLGNFSDGGQHLIHFGYSRNVAAVVGRGKRPVRSGPDRQPPVLWQ